MGMLCEEGRLEQFLALSGLTLARLPFHVGAKGSDAPAAATDRLEVCGSPEAVAKARHLLLLYATV